MVGPSSRLSFATWKPYTLGIRSCVVSLFYKIGWHKFLKLSTRTYRALTLKFLSTMEVDSANGINFRMFNTDRHLNEGDLYTIFNFAIEGNIGPKNKPAPYIKDDIFWQEITGLTTNYDSQHAKVSLIRHPVMRLAPFVLGRMPTMSLVLSFIYSTAWHIIMLFPGSTCRTAPNVS